MFTGYHDQEQHHSQQPKFMDKVLGGEIDPFFVFCQLIVNDETEGDRVGPLERLLNDGTLL
jgi:hypothetical protein